MLRCSENFVFFFFFFVCAKNKQNKTKIKIQNGVVTKKNEETQEIATIVLQSAQANIKTNQNEAQVVVYQKTAQKIEVEVEVITPNIRNIKAIIHQTTVPGMSLATKNKKMVVTPKKCKFLSKKRTKTNPKRFFFIVLRFSWICCDFSVWKNQRIQIANTKFRIFETRFSLLFFLKQATHNCNKTTKEMRLLFQKLLFF